MGIFGKRQACLSISFYFIHATRTPSVGGFRLMLKHLTFKISYQEQKSQSAIQMLLYQPLSIYVTLSSRTVNLTGQKKFFCAIENDCNYEAID